MDISFSAELARFSRAVQSLKYFSDSERKRQERISNRRSEAAKENAARRLDAELAKDEPTHIAIIKFVARNPRCTRRDISADLGIPRTTLEKYVARLYFRKYIALPPGDVPHQGRIIHYIVTPLGAKSLKEGKLQ